MPQVYRADDGLQETGEMSWKMRQCAQKDEE